MATAKILLEIRQDDVGKIIGKAGSRIRQIETDSCARVRVNKPDGSGNGSYSTVELTGSEKAVESARRLIEDIVDVRVCGRNDVETRSSSGRFGAADVERSNRYPTSDRGYASRDNEPKTGWGSNSWKTDASSGWASARTNNDTETDRSVSGWGNEPQRSKSVVSSATSNPDNKSNAMDMEAGDDEWSEDRLASRATNKSVSRASNEWADPPSSGHSGWGSAKATLDSSDMARGSPSSSSIGGWANQKDDSRSYTKSNSGWSAPKANGWSNSSNGGWGADTRKRERDSYAMADDSDGSMNGSDRFYSSPKKFVAETQVSDSATGSTSAWAAIRASMAEQAAARWAGLAPIIKNFYIEDPHVSAMTPEEVDALRSENNNIMVQDLAAVSDRKRIVPNPIRTFQQAFAHYPDVLAALLRLNFERPSPIQAQAWPVLLSGLDMIGIAQTGTGKTLAFLLPAFVHIEGQSTPREERSREGPSALVLTPTRELALQIDEEVRKLNYHGMRCCCVYGGGSRKQQVDVVTKGVDFIVATPGRLDDLMMSNVVSLRHVTYLVLDEADRMLDLGFEPQINKILLDIRSDRQTVMTSATWPPGVRRLAGKYTKDPIQVFVGTLDLQACANVRQVIDLVDVSEKRERLIRFLRSEMNLSRDKVIVFVDRKTTVDDLASDLALLGIPCDAIHGDRVQSAREQALTDFRSGATRILIATDVASRGLDIRDVTHVFNFALPKNMEDYVHRIGRTGRAGRSGTAITLVTRDDWRQAAELIRVLEQAQQTVPRGLRDMASRYDEMMERKKADRGSSYGRSSDRDRSFRY